MAFDFHPLDIFDLSTDDESTEVVTLPPPLKGEPTKSRFSPKRKSLQELWGTEKRQSRSKTSGTPTKNRPLKRLYSGSQVQSRPAKKRAKLSKKAEETSERAVATGFFKGTLLYFFPATETSKARSLRVQRALESGAVRTKEWTHNVTHVIVDSEYHINDVLRHVEVKKLPHGVIVVNDDYTPDCISAQRLLDPHQCRFHVKGCKPPPKLSIASRSFSRSSSSDNLPHTSSPIREEEKSPEPEEIESQRSLPSHIQTSRGLVVAYADHDISSSPPYQLSDGESSQDYPLKEITQSQSTKIIFLKMDPLDIDEPIASPEDAAVDTENNWQKGFSCMQKHDESTKSSNPNKHTIEVLEQMANHYERTLDNWRLNGYRKAIATLKKQKTLIKTKEEAKALPAIGERLAEKIEEIVKTGKLQQLEETTEDPKDTALYEFSKIYGVGHKQAAAWVEQGYRTLDDLEKNATLTKNQKIGLAHFEDFQARIPREEIDLHLELVRGTLAKISKSFQVDVSGSYRRGAETSGDIDFIITANHVPFASWRRQFVEDVIPSFFQMDYLKAALSAGSADHGSKWHGAACLPLEKVWRRVDFLFVPSNELGAAMLYFTGNDIFNRSIRLLASKKGYRLNQHGLFTDVMRGEGRKKITEGTLVESKDERKIFEILGVPWREPEHRNS